MSDKLGPFELNTIVQGDCLELMKEIPDNSVDCVVTDTPYGTTDCKWDTVIPFEPMWEQLKRITKGNSAIVLTGSQPFTSKLVMSNVKNFKHEIIWEKSRATNYLNSKNNPMKYHENIMVFCYGKTNYYPQKTKRQKPWRKIQRSNNKGDGAYKKDTRHDGHISFSGYNYPSSIVSINNPVIYNNSHPTQKPVELMKYLIKTYSDSEDIILDFTCGSGTTLVAAKQLGRRFLGFELEEKYCEIARQRLAQEELF